MSKDPYWTCIDANNNNHNQTTHEHRMPHGTLVLVETHWNSCLATSIVFIPAAPHPGQERL